MENSLTAFSSKEEENCMEQRYKKQGTRHKVQGTRNKVQGIRNREEEPGPGFEKVCNILNSVIIKTIRGP
ncbi:MAG: hypothetical protein ACXWC7_01420, partial [Chitinophagaceae bacterium]